jgi:hypothetical protein
MLKKKTKEDEKSILVEHVQVVDSLKKKDLLCYWLSMPLNVSNVFH